ncbi:MAG: SDR family NAD(P)-dependent oxidoreductase, partial [Pseudomonadota bacterium]
MRQDLQGKKILVTGGSRGIGAEIAKFLAAEGAQVCITYSSNASSAEKVLGDLGGEGHLSLQMD